VAGFLPETVPRSEVTTRWARMADKQLDLVRRIRSFVREDGALVNCQGERVVSGG